MGAVAGRGRSHPLLAGSPFFDETIRLGGGYLVDLVSILQRGNRLRVNLESGLAP
jgi:hypothetical protein